MADKVNDVLLPESQEIYIGKEKIIIEELPRDKYGKLAEVIGNSLEKLAVGTDFEIDDFGQLFKFISDDVLLDIYAIQTGKEKEWLNKNLRLRQEVALMKAIYEVNRLDEVVKNFMPLVRSIPGIGTIIEKYQRLNLKQ